MTSLTRDLCPSCGAWLILAEVLYVAPAARKYPHVGSQVIYECPSCSGVFETWAYERDPLVELPVRDRLLRDSLAARRPAPRA